MVLGGGGRPSMPVVVGWVPWQRCGGTSGGFGADYLLVSNHMEMYFFLFVFDG